MNAPRTLVLQDSVLVLVDYQGRLMPAIHGGAGVLAEGLRLADTARALGVPVIGTEQNPAGLGPNDAALSARCDTTLTKLHFDACADGLLDAIDQWHPALPPRAPRDVVIAGCEAHVCLLQTALGLLRAGHRAWVVAPACGSRTAEDRRLGLNRLERAGATLVSREMVSFEWLQHCRHGRFKDVLPLLRQPLASS